MANDQSLQAENSGQNQQKQESIHLQVLNKTFELLTTALSLVAALAWNDAIQSLFSKIFGNASTIWAKFAYALLVTAIIVWMGVKAAQTQKALSRIVGVRS
jgi:FtsH-binding integral membrane protein